MTRLRFPWCVIHWYDGRLIGMMEMETGGEVVIL